MLHARIYDDVTHVVSQLIHKDGIYPEYAGRSITYVINELVKDSPRFKDAIAQIKSTQHPRPYGKKK